MSHHHICPYCSKKDFDCECDFPQMHLLVCENCEEKDEQIKAEIEAEELYLDE